ncbi:hypothetical protein AX15_006657 [Amanita polypyramis BW_CC]|nr:hypothetical protein AX15_006657 [Amanita polypyramis BW_CC]
MTDPLDSVLNVAVLGPLGTYTHEAAYSRFGSHVIYNEQRTITDVFNSLSEAVSVAVVPQENSIFGSVVETYDNFRRANCSFVQGEILLKIQHCLVVRRGVSLGDVRRVMSHEQALGQCQAFLKIHLPDVEQMRMPSTASAARALLENPPDCAAICSRLCVSMFNGLEILREGIQTIDVNYTRFLVLTTNRAVTIPPSFPAAPRYIALFRIVVGSSVSNNQQIYSNNLIQVLKSLDTEMNITRIDRRPNLEAALFQDIYFVEVKKLLPLSFPDIAAWAAEVDRTVQVIKQTGTDVDIIGIW